MQRQAQQTLAHGGLRLTRMDAQPASLARMLGRWNAEGRVPSAAVGAVGVNSGSGSGSSLAVPGAQARVVAQQRGQAPILSIMGSFDRSALGERSYLPEGLARAAAERVVAMDGDGDQHGEGDGHGGGRGMVGSGSGCGSSSLGSPRGKGAGVGSAFSQGVPTNGWVQGHGGGMGAGQASMD